jgi:hypothetical protein
MCAVGVSSSLPLSRIRIAGQRWSSSVSIANASLTFPPQSVDDDESDDDAPEAVSLSTARDEAQAAQDALRAQQAREREQAKEKRRVCVTELVHGCLAWHRQSAQLLRVPCR